MFNHTLLLRCYHVMQLHWKYTCSFIIKEFRVIIQCKSLKIWNSTIFCLIIKNNQLFKKRFRHSCLQKSYSLLTRWVLSCQDGDQSSRPSLPSSDLRVRNQKERTMLPHEPIISYMIYLVVIMNQSFFLNHRWYED